MRQFGTIALAVVALLTWSACGSDDGGGGSAGGGETIEVKATDFAFDPSTITVDQAGSVTFHLVNDGKTEHALEIEGNGVEEETDTIAPGETVDLTVDLKEGEYEMYCPVDGHRDLGMEGTVQIGAGAGGGGT